MSFRIVPDLNAAELRQFQEQRGIYFLLPLLLSAALLAAFEIRQVVGRATPAIVGAASRTAPLLTPKFVGVLVFALGVMLIVSGATPSPGSRAATLQATLPLWVVESAHFLASLDGVILLFAVPGLLRRMDGAWWAYFVPIVMNFVFSLAKGLAYGKAAVTLLVVILLLSRRQFSRRAPILRAPISLGWWLAVVNIIATDKRSSNIESLLRQRPLEFMS